MTLRMKNGVVTKLGASEDQEQITVAEWLHLHPGLVWTATANGGVRHKKTAGRLKAMGVIAGVPDLLIFTAPTDLEGCGLAIEMKRADGGGGATKPQREFMNRLESCGWICFVANGAGEAIEILERYYGGYGAPGVVIPRFAPPEEDT